MFWVIKMSNSKKTRINNKYLEFSRELPFFQLLAAMLSEILFSVSSPS